MKALLIVLLLACTAQAQSLNLPYEAPASSNFHWANDSWIGQDKVFDHASFAFVLAQLTEDTFVLDNGAKRGMALTVNLVPWLVKEIVDGYGEEGASYKDFIWSAVGAGLALVIH